MNKDLYYFEAQVKRIVDGDTLDLLVDLGFRVKRKVRVRLKDIDTPEIYFVEKDNEEYEKGVEALNFVRERIQVNDIVTIRSYKDEDDRGKYGRWIADVYYEEDGEEISLVEELKEHEFDTN